MSPLEICIEIIIHVILLLQGSYILVILMTPLTIYNVFMYLELSAKMIRLLRKSYNVYALFRKDYRDFTHNYRTLIIKSGVYAFVCMISLVRFILALTNTAVANFVGDSYFSKWDA